MRKIEKFILREIQVTRMERDRTGEGNESG